MSAHAPRPPRQDNTFSRRAVLLAGAALPLALATRGLARAIDDGLVLRDGWVLRADDLPRLTTG